MENDDKRGEFVAGLRALADLYEQQEKLPLPPYGLTLDLDAKVWRKSTKPGANEWEQELDPEASKRSLKRIVRSMGRGRKDKKYTDYNFQCIKKLSDNVSLRVVVDREVACRPVKTGRMIVHPAHTYTIEERIVEEIEYVCDDALLKG